MVAASIVSWLLIRLGVFPCRPMVYELIFSKKWLTHCLPVGICKAATLTCGTATTIYLNVEFIQMLKAFSPVVVLATSGFLKVEAPRGGVILAVVAISSGTAFTCGFDPSAGAMVLSLHAGAALTEAIHLVLTQFLLQNMSFSVVEAQFALAPPGVLFLALAAVVLEWGDMIRSGDVWQVVQNPFTFIAAATLGLAINFLTFMVIQETSSLSLKVLGMARNLGLVFIGVTFYHEIVPTQEAMGFACTLCGLVAYYHCKANNEHNERVHSTLVRCCCPKKKRNEDDNDDGEAEFPSPPYLNPPSPKV